MTIVDSRRVRYLFFLLLFIVGAQILELFAFAALSASAPSERQSAMPFDMTTFTSAAFVVFAPSVGPFLVFAMAGLFVFRQFYWALWCLALCASAYALLILVGLLGEYGMARAAVEAAQRG